MAETKDNSVVLAVLSRGAAVMVGEFRGGKAERIDYTDKKTFKRTHFNRVLNSFEVGPASEQVHVTERLPEDTDVSKHAVQHRKGQHFAIEVESITVARGSKTVAAIALHPISG
jgi:hypothetical protein